MNFFDFYEQQTFKDLVNSEDVYVDKTGLICELYRKHTKFEMLCRPFGFGKSVLVDTIANLFRHRYEDFFSNLNVAKSDVEIPKQNVMRLNFATNDLATSIELQDYLYNYYRARAFENELALDLDQNDSIYWQTVSYIKALAAKSPTKKIVVLIDNYDNAILKNLFTDTSKDYYRALLNFLSALYDNEDIIDWCLILGETKFYLATEELGGIPYIKDLTFEGHSTHICGFTEGEMHTYYDNFIQDEADALGESSEEFLSNLFDWYGNFRLTEQNIRVMRPKSICSFLNLRDQNQYRQFYEYNHVSSILMKLLNKYGRFHEKLLIPNSCGYNFTDFSYIDNVKPFALLFQMGFLSLHHIDINVTDTLTTYNYYANFTNKEMRDTYYLVLEQLKLK